MKCGGRNQREFIKISARVRKVPSPPPSPPHASHHLGGFVNAAAARSHAAPARIFAFLCARHNDILLIPRGQVPIYAELLRRKAPTTTTAAPSKCKRDSQIDQQL